MANSIYEIMSHETRTLFVFARQTALSLGLNRVTPEALLLALLDMTPNDVVAVLKDMGMYIEDVKAEFHQLALQDVRPSGVRPADGLGVSLDPATKNALKWAATVHNMALRDGKPKIELRHVLLGLMNAALHIATAFDKYNIDENKFCAHYKHIYGMDGSFMPDDDDCPVAGEPAGKDAAPDKAGWTDFFTDLTALARHGKLDKVIGRENEAEQIMTVLCRRKKNNALLLGKPGVGKTAIAEAIAIRIAKGAVPARLKKSKLISLDVAALVAGTKYRGEFEQRMRRLTDGLKANRNCIVFIDEIHTLIGAGAGSNRTLDAANILKPLLAKNEMRCIGATTHSEYRQYFEADAAMARRFQKVEVAETNLVETAAILAGLRKQYEQHHGCVVVNDALAAAIRLTDRLVPDRCFPDKAMDCLDSACARAAWNATAKRKPTVDAEVIIKQISRQLDIPLDFVRASGTERVALLEKNLRADVFGQDQAIETVVRVLESAFCGMGNPERPLGVFMLGGPSGTGKTYLCKQMARHLYGKESALIRLDMSEYSERYAVSRLIGSAPGYVGFNETESLCEKILRAPYAVLLLDEIEKAHASVIRFFLQVLGEGRLTDSRGLTADFRHAIIVMTGNFNETLRANALTGFSEENRADNPVAVAQGVADYCNRLFGHEFTNRIDAFVPFAPLSEDSLMNISARHRRDLSDRLSGRGHILSFSPKVDELAVARALRPDEHGQNANSVSRIYVREIGPLIARTLCQAVGRVGSIAVGVRQGEFTCKAKIRPAPQTRSELMREMEEECVL